MRIVSEFLQNLMKSLYNYQRHALYIVQFRELCFLALRIFLILVNSRRQLYNAL